MQKLSYGEVSGEPSLLQGAKETPDSPQHNWPHRKNERVAPKGPSEPTLQSCPLAIKK